ncbi:protein FAR1-RELATED SEQUENCE 5-like [Rosa rugosa]|uniref:protein FAR1-RELATED SEQUENCE 5-like n=1 Tax=Rosa rugosa TaxID=74645 RepID=UPI002B4110BC|nr:protein FAR1-RELATED SEQUENCE 5-like [Rosa rugosa]
MESGSDMNHLQYNCVRFDRLSANDVLGKEFKSVEEAEIFYFAYAKAMGFDVRKDDKYVSARMGRVTIRQLVCSAQGKRREEYMNNSNKVRMPKKLTRCNCPCLFKVRYFKKNNSYVVVDFKTNHSHDLAQPHESHLLKSHQSVPDSHLALAKSMRRVPIKVCHTYQYMADRAGGLTKVGFIRKDLYNKLDISRREALLEGDAKAALSYLEGKAATDKKLFCKYSTDESNRLANLFWRDSTSLLDYSCFGDVLVFDSTYKTNHYEKPLVLFAGSNHHLSTTIFGFALLVDETVETYTWALQMFLESMKGKKPIAVLTDGDEAMRKAIEVVFPYCPHRLCTWHIAKNAQSNLHNLEVIAEFRRCMFDEATPYGFEQRWNDMVNKFDLRDKNWLEKHASTIYTDSVFYLVREEIEQVGSSRIMRFRTSSVYITSSYNNNEENECTTIYHHLESNPRIEIPLSLVMKRWTKHAKSEIQSTIPEDNIPGEALQLIRHGDLSYLGSKVSYLALKTKEGTDILRNELVKLEPVLEEILNQQKEIIVSSSDCDNILKDPIKVRSKGMQGTENSKRPKNNRKCSLCKNYGHTKPRCPKKNRVRGRTSRVNHDKNFNSDNVQQPPKKKPKV